MTRKEEFEDLLRRGFIPNMFYLGDGTLVIRWTPEVVEWWAATSTYCTARDDGTLTKAHCKKSAKRG